MYSQGETFYRDIDDEEYELHVVENFTLREREYIIAEDFNGDFHVFIYDEDEDDIVLLDEFDAADIIEYWEEEYLSGDNIGDYEDDEYYDREDEEYQERYDNDNYNEDYY